LEIFYESLEIVLVGLAMVVVIILIIKNLLFSYQLIILKLLDYVNHPTFMIFYLASKRVFMFSRDKVKVNNNILTKILSWFTK
jgi:hypothetical protein